MNYPCGTRLAFDGRSSREAHWVETQLPSMVGHSPIQSLSGVGFGSLICDFGMERTVTTGNGTAEFD